MDASGVVIIWLLYKDHPSIKADLDGKSDLLLALFVLRCSVVERFRNYFLRSTLT
jgi:hypothetical protein